MKRRMIERKKKDKKDGKRMDSKKIIDSSYCVCC